MFRRTLSLILALSLSCLRPNPCASESVVVSSLRPVNSPETEPVLDKLTAGLEENPMDARITRAQKFMEEGRVQEAAIELFETLEDLALDDGLKFTRWEDAHRLLAKAKEKLDLMAVIGHLPDYYLR